MRTSIRGFSTRVPRFDLWPPLRKRLRSDGSTNDEVRSIDPKTHSQVSVPFDSHRRLADLIAGPTVLTCLLIDHLTGFPPGAVLAIATQMRDDSVDLHRQDLGVLH